MSTIKKSLEQKKQNKLAELAKIEERISKDNERKRQLKVEIQDLEAAEFRQVMAKSGFTIDDLKVLLEGGSPLHNQ